MPAPKRFPATTFLFHAPIILGFPNLFTARTYQNNPNDKPRFDCKALLRPDHVDLPQLNALIGKVGGDAFGQRAGIHYCLADGNVLAQAGGANEAFKGFYVLTMRSQFMNDRALGVRVGGRDVQVAQLSVSKEQAERDYFYGGVEAALEIEVLAYEMSSTNFGVTARPKLVLSLAHGERIEALNGGGGISADKFAHVKGHVTNVDPMAPLAIGTPAF